VINPKAAPCDEAAIRSIAPATNCIASQKPWVLLATILASSITYIDESVVNIALPAIESNGDYGRRDSVAGERLHAESFGAFA
jgi:hypothetical protein